MSDVLTQIRDLSPAKQKLLLERLKRRREAERPPEDVLGPSPARSLGEPLPLSFAQERLWFLHGLAPESPAYHIPAVVRLDGDLVVPALAQTLRGVVDRHESLRSRFPSEDGRPRLEVTPPGRFQPPRVDLSGLAASDRSRESRRQVASVTRRPFDLARGPVLRAVLVRTRGTEHRLALVIHHIVSDGWSRGILVREVATLYGAFVRGRPAELPPLPVQYADFADWQRRRLSGDRLDELLGHWTRTLQGAPPVLDLPTDRPPPPRSSGRGRRHAFRLSPSLGSDLRDLARGRSTTLFTVLAAGFAAFLGRHAQQRDVVLGTPVAGRDAAEVEELVGLFVNTLALRVRLAGEPTGHEVVERTRETVQDAFEHRELPFERLVAHLDPDRGSGRPPVFQAMVVLQNLPAAEASLPGLELALEDGEVTTAKLDLTLHLSERPDGGLAASFEYSTDLFDATTVARWARRFPRFLAELTSNPNRNVWELPMALPGERHQVLLEWGRPGVCETTRGTLVDGFDQQARRAPDRVAVVDGELQLTYGALWHRARGLAARLTEDGVGAERRVALRFDRSAELVTAILGVLASGGAYVPLDPAHPRQRQRYVMDDAGVVAEYDTLPAVGSSASEGTRSRSFPESENAAYVIYTSGSTGQPKGVVVTHANATRLWPAVLRKRFDFDADDVWSFFHSPAFDFSVWEIWGALLFGGRLVVVSRRTSRSPDAFADLLTGERVTVLSQTPSAFRQLQAVEADRTTTDLTSLRWVVFGGEALEPTTLAPWWRRHGDGRHGRGPRLVNMYGITETTVHVTFRELRADDVRSVVGRPLEDLGVVLLDVLGRPVPPGVVGEIHVSGEGLARGYLGRPALTAARFVPDGVFDTEGSRLYRSGDLARWRSDGDLEFLGRLDHQVQLRGFRIELGEIESALAEHPSVHEAAVLPRGTGDATRLVAYVVADEGTGREELREQAARRLPDYMIPGAFVFLPALPLTPNGKVDRRTLADMEPITAPADEDERLLEPPRTPREEILAGLFAEVLELDRVGATESFFDLGGHSLLATRLISRARQALAVELPLGALFEHATVRELARAVERLEPTTEEIPPPLEPIPGDEPAPLSFSQERLWFLDRLEPGTPAYDISLRLWLDGVLAGRRLGQSLDEVVRRHEALRTRFVSTDSMEDQVVQHVDPPLRRPLPAVDLTGLSPEDREHQARRLARRAAYVSFDLARGPLVAAALVRTTPARHLFLFTVHHIVADGWSLGVLSRELTRLYEAYGEGRPSPLPDLPVQYGDYAVWQRAWLSGSTLKRHVEHWRQRLAGVEDLDLPTDRPRPPVQTFRGGRVPWSLTPRTVDDLRHVARRHGATLFMVLAAGLRVVLGRWSGQRDFALGTFVANRTRAETEDLIGFFVNNLALRAPLEAQSSFGDHVSRERKTALAAYAHQQLPFETLLQELDVPRDMSRSSLFQAMLVLQNTPRPDLDLANVTVRGMTGKDGRANFDLTLWTFEDEDDGSLRGAFEYATALFDRTTVGRLAEHLTVLLDSAARKPENRLEDLPLLADGEQAQLLHEWAAPAPVPTSVWTSLPARIRHLARQRPDAVAVVFPQDSGDGAVWHVTYGELTGRASQLAGRLAALGVGRGDRVAIYDERTPESLAALLAVMERGAAYVPLDATYGTARLPVVIEEAGVDVLLTRQGLLGEDSGESPEIVDLDRWPEDEPVPPLTLAPAEAAYVIYTSGTTGRPKGVVVTHDGLSTLYEAWNTAYDLPMLNCHLQTASLSFDVFAGDWVRALGSGAKLLLVPAELRLDAEALWDLIVREGVDVGEVVPAVLRPILDVLDARGRDLAPLRLLLVGSDAWYVEEMRRVAKRLPQGARLVDSYGVTEATIDSTWFLFEETTAGTLPAEALAPIGRPFPGCRAWVAAPDRNLCPAGVPGELWLGGPGVARGYLARPARTADRFAPDPFSGDPGQRLYRTGDRARWRADGNLELLGRMDQQLKVRGFRIEPGEIEAVLGEHPQVHQAVVAARGPSPGEERLIAYVTTTETEPTAADLRAFLADRLPDYMVPTVYVPLDAFPLTPNGKVDRRALPSPDWSTAHLGATYEPPRAGTEATLAELYGKVLGGDRIGAGDGFFERGGHSLSATRLVSRVRRAFDVDLPLRAVFEEPTVRGLARRIEGLLGETPTATVPLEKIPRDTPPPLSFAQERLWFLDRLEPGRATYHLFTALAVDGPLDAGRLASALQRLAARHETLRTTFSGDDGATDGGEPRQRIAAHAVLPVPLADLSGLTTDDQQRKASMLTRKEARRPFDLSSGPLLRLSLLRFRSEGHRALLTQHHVISDAWSMGIFWNELARLYDGGDLSPLPIQYADFAVWQRRRLAGEVLESELEYWRRRLADLPVSLELPTDRPRPSVQSQRGRRLPVVVPAGVTARLRAVSVDRGATLFMTLMAGFTALLHRLSGQDRLAVGTPVANRTRAELEGLIGFFVNTLVLDADFAEGPSFERLLDRIRDAALGAYGHQDLPFERLVEDLASQRDLSRTPLFQAIFAFQNAPPVTATRARDLTLRPLPAGTGTAKFDLGLELFERGEELAGYLEYATDLFDPTTVERWSRYFGRLLEAASRHPATQVSELPLLSPAERHQLACEWQDLPRAADPLLPLEHIDRWIERMPDAVAVTGPDRVLTWGELGRRAEALAHRLLREGVGKDPEGLVALRLEPSPATLVAIVGVWRAGAAYLPLDPAHPPGRVEACLDDAQPRALVSTEELTIHRLRPLPQPVAPARGPRSKPSRDHLAYVVYTSGSTGRPKGVAVSHGALARLVSDHPRVFGGDPEDRVALVGGPAFDIQVLELGAALSVGASLHAPDADTRRSPERLSAWAAEENLTGLFLATPLAETLIRTTVPPSVRWLCAGGDRLRVRATLDAGYRLVNAYGPTESTVVATIGPVATGRSRPGERRFPPAIGRPRGDATVHVLDRSFERVPPGVAGELWAGGGSLARGYLNQPAMTAASFVPDPFSETPGRRLYGTGDRVRWRADGRIDFLDRLDAQVQVRGFRVEPGEIEVALESHPAVGSAVVLATTTPTGGVRLDACFEPLRGGAPAVEPAELREFLRDRLPEPMVPATFTLVDELPLTPNGKIDRKAVEEHISRARDSATAWDPTPTEEILAGLWRDVLQVDVVGPDADFFALGGHSLAATRIAARIRDAVGVELPLQEFFRQPTVRSLAGRIDARRAEAVGLGGQPVRPVPRDPKTPLPLSFSQERFWILARLDRSGAAYNLPLAVRLEGTLSAASLGATLDELEARHEALRTTFRLEDDRAFQEIHPPSPGGLRRVDLSGLPAAASDDEATRLARAAARRPFDLETGPAFRATLVRQAPARHVFSVVLPHAAADEGAMDVLLSEVLGAYEEGRRGRPSGLGPPALQIADVAVWQRNHLTGETLDRLLAFWRSFLGETPPPLETPTDRPRPPRMDYAGAAVGAVLDTQVTSAARELAGKSGATLFVLLLAAFEATLFRWTGQGRFVVGTPVSQRDRTELERVVGPLLNTLALPVDLGDDPTFQTFLERTRNEFLAAWDHRDLPFERLLEDVDPSRDVSRPPLYQALMVLQQVGEEPASSTDLTVHPTTGGTATSKLDLTLFARPAGQVLVLSLEYATSLFDRTTAKRFLDHWRTLLETATAEPGLRISQLPVLPPPVRHQILHEWCDTAAAYPDSTLPELLARQALRTPDAVAVTCGPWTLSYGELHRRAGRLACRLRDLGVGLDRPVAVLLDRSLELMVALWGIFETGAAYLPLSPDDPPRRLAELIDEAHPDVVVATPALADRLPDGVRWVDPLPSAAPAAPTGPPASPESLAYVIYTSGSTGRPKGVMVSHRAIVNRLTWFQRSHPLSTADRVLQKTPVTFDVSVWELFWPLVEGARLVFARPGGHRDAGYLAKLVVDEGITLLHFVPSLLRIFVEEPAVSQIRSVGRVVASGEALPPDLVRTFLDRFAPDTTPDVHNLYGPTEAAVEVTAHLCTGAERGSVPLGRPVANTAIRVVDSHFRPVAPGTPGELWIGGVQLARGYLDRASLTAERFVPDPFSGVAGARCYRTGDLSRWLPEGRVDYLGRLDHQVKVRGVRIELGEVESALIAHPAVREAVVVARGEAEALRLVAYLVLREDVDPTALRAYLADRLPDAYVPSLFVTLDGLPLTTSGKVDRKALPEPEAPTSTVEREPPEGPVEEVLAGMFAEILDLDEVGRRDSFFELGGHSLTAARLLAWVRESFETEIALARVFEEPTVAGLAIDLTAEEDDRPRIERTAELLLELAEMDEDELAAELDEEA